MTKSAKHTKYDQSWVIKSPVMPEKEARSDNNPLHLYGCRAGFLGWLVSVPPPWPCFGPAGTVTLGHSV